MINKIDPQLLQRVKILTTYKTQEVIVFLRDFCTGKHFIQNFDDCSILGEYPFIRALAVSVKQNELFRLASQTQVEYVASVMCAKTLMYNARKKINVDNLHKKGITGKGVTVAVIDTGCYPHIDFLLGKSRVKKFVDFVASKVSLYDDNGHGTFVTGVLGGSGLVSNGRYVGIAPDCEIVVLKALNADGQTQAFKVLDAMQWIYENRFLYNIRVVCMSFGSTPLAKNDPLTMGANSLWDAGIVVVGAVGNDGPKSGSVKSPGSSSKIITVGCADTRGEQVKIAEFSSRGPIFELVKPDLVAPGVEITSLSNSKSFYTKMTGSSVSAPFVAGASALLLQQNKMLTPNQVKSLLMTSTIKLPFGVNDCGAGLIDFSNFELSL
ncbi:MAG: S8 family peptidase [Clostridia bacterium]|nr:S8 family peptidase [Clostridia bacterium]